MAQKGGGKKAGGKKLKGSGLVAPRRDPQTIHHQSGRDKEGSVVETNERGGKGGKKGMK